ncbi:hypothetical protein AMK23_34515 [Streptomyces sp. CB02130]|uniref:hypothetical protein n=1 Tax=Streptomyces sp. CB02130 TaxID=1703934 RepID=UPI0009389837|nr:hypothetical protein [Streptomyces sp. CB02130]OKJ19400.1 hypothetical protein AMK23_34515 [Streptomyces sp. CB02130]
MGGTRSRWNSTSVWLSGVALVGVLALGGYALFSGDEGDEAGKKEAGSSVSADPKPSKSYEAPEDWTDPKRWAALPRGERTDERGSQVGFPQIAEGAVAMMAAANTSAIEGTTTNGDEQLRLYYSYIGKPDQSEAAAERVEQGAITNGKSIWRSLGLKPGAPLPAGAYARTHVIGFQFIKKSPTEVTAWVLGSETLKAGETEEEKVSYTRTLMGAQWQDGDWKLSVEATRHAQDDTQGKPEPEMAAVGDAKFDAAGWTAIREAS